MRVLVTGSRDWTDEIAVRSALDEVYAMWCEEGCIDGEFVVVHGGARGADTIAGRWADLSNRVDERVRVEAVPAEWDRYGKAAGHLRNHDMVSRGADVCLAFPLGASPGTRGCMRLARSLGIQVINCTEVAA